MKQIERLVRGFGLLWMGDHFVSLHDPIGDPWIDIPFALIKLGLFLGLTAAGIVSLIKYIDGWLEERESYKTKISTKT